MSLVVDGLRFAIVQEPVEARVEEVIPVQEILSK